MTITRDRLEALVRQPVPLPGSGNTFDRWTFLARVGEEDLALAKLVEPHVDALAILSEIADVDHPTGTWAVWAAEPPFARLVAIDGANGWVLEGRKAFCSGAELVTHALVTAEVGTERALFAIDLANGHVTVDPDAPAWTGAGMADAGTVTLRLRSVPARVIGRPGDYVARPGFWHGAVGVAAVWWGGARGVARQLELSDHLDPHGFAHRGAVRAALDTCEAVLRDAARRIDADPEAPCERLAQSVRATVATAVDTVLHHVGRATGPGPLAFDTEHAQRVADLTVFVRQHHAERDLQRLGELGGDA